MYVREKEREREREREREKEIERERESKCGRENETGNLQQQSWASLDLDCDSPWVEPEFTNISLTYPKNYRKKIKKVRLKRKIKKEKTRIVYM